MNSFGLVTAASIIIALLILASKGIRRWVPVFDRFFLPTSVIAGLLGLCLGPQIAGRFYEEGSYLSQGIFPAPILEVWRQMPGILISFVFAGLFLGKKLPPFRKVARLGGPQALLGYTISFGQYAVGLFITLLILAPLMKINPLSGLLLEISLSGGHGTAAGLAGTFRELGFAEGLDLALGLATIGLISGVVLGTAFINFAVRSKAITIAREEPASEEEQYDLTSVQDNEQPGHKPASDTTSDPLTLHLALLSVALILGELLRRMLVSIEGLTYGPLTGDIMSHVPLFPVAMIGGAILQAGLTATGKDQHVSRELINRITGLCLDFIIVSALATMSLSSIGKNWAAFVILAVAGMGWTVFCFWVLAPRMLPDRWFERGIGDFGQGTGMVVSGLLLMRIADPKNKSGAFEAFGCKQLAFEPFLGGGIITAVTLPLCARLGPMAMLVFFSVATLAAIALGTILFGPTSKDS